jgi:hypothetical protein
VFAAPLPLAARLSIASDGTLCTPAGTRLSTELGPQAGSHDQRPGRASTGAPPNRQHGGFVEGTITFEPGERDQPIIALKNCSRRDNAELV